MDLRSEFVDETKKRFRFLETSFGFTLRSTEAPFVIYDSDKVRVYVYFDAERRCELDVRLERVIDTGKRIPSFGLGEFMLLHGLSNADVHVTSYPATKEALSVELGHLAGLVSTYTEDVLRGNLETLEKIVTLREKMEAEMSRNIVKKPPLAS